MFTSLAWYTTCLFGEGLIRAIFLFRNFSTKIESRTYVLLIVFILVECLYAYILLQTTFFKYSGYTYDEGINQLTGAATVVFPSDQKIPGVYQPPASGAVGSAGVAIHTLIRSFINWYFVLLDKKLSLRSCLSHPCLKTRCVLFLSCFSSLYPLKRKFISL